MSYLGTKLSFVFFVCVRARLWTSSVCQTNQNANVLTTYTHCFVFYCFINLNTQFDTNQAFWLSYQTQFIQPRLISQQHHSVTSPINFIVSFGTVYYKTSQIIRSAYTEMRLFDITSNRQGYFRSNHYDQKQVQVGKQHATTEQQICID